MLFVFATINHFILSCILISLLTGSVAGGAFIYKFIACCIVRLFPRGSGMTQCIMIAPVPLKKPEIQ